MDLENIFVTEHAGQRFAERFRGQTEFESKSYYIRNQEEVDSNVIKMLEHAELVYHGQMAAFPRRRYYMNGQTIIIVSDCAETIITIFKVKFGSVSEATNKILLDAVREELDQHVEELNIIQEEADSQIKDLEANIVDSNERIQDLKKEIEIEKDVIKLNKDYINYQKGIVYQKSLIVRDLFKTILGKDFGQELIRREEE